MNTPTPTPRTDAAWTSSFEGKQLSAGQTARALRECSQKLETELAALRADLATERDKVRVLREAFGRIENTADEYSFGGDMLAWAGDIATAALAATEVAK